MPIEVIPQPTPNPNAFKFTVRGKTFDGPVTFGSADAAAGTPFAEALFKIPGVTSCFATADFVTITKEPAADWGHILEPAKLALTEHL